MAIENLKQLFDSLLAIKPEWDNLRSNPKLNCGAELEWFMQACEKSTYAKDAALGNVDATFAAFRNIAAVGVSLDPARKLAYIVPRDKKMSYDLSYMGLMHLATSSGSIQWAQARIVHENDVFELSGYDAPPTHRFKPFGKPEERGPVIGAYVVVKTLGGDYLTNAMHVDEINGIRDRSPSWKKDQSGPWKTDWPEMAKKTLVKNAHKYWPDPSDKLATAIHYLNTDGGQGIDLSPEDEAKTASAIADDFIAKVNKATVGTEVATAWHQARGHEVLAANPDALAKVREAVAARNRALGVQPPAATPAPSAAPTATPAPTPAPAPARGPAATPAPTMSEQGKILEALGKARSYEEVEALGPRIDALPAEEQVECNDAYNQRSKYLEQFGGTLPDGTN